MEENLSSTTFLPWLAEEAQRCAKTSLTGSHLHDELWKVALDAASWLRSLPSEERRKSLQTIQECLNTSTSLGVTIPTNEREAYCLVTLLSWVINPPPVL